MSADWTSALARARENAPFLARALDRRPDLAELLAAGEEEQALLAAKQVEAADIPTALRRERLGLALVLAVGDLAGAFDLYKVMRELSFFADRALHDAIGAAILRRVPDAEPAGLIGLALGKHGAGELNYSSDIDPILLYEPETLARRERDEPGEAAQRYAREIVRLLSEVTAEGYVFRVDLRLRPASEVSPLAIPLDAAITHYESSALAWERAAFIRARACAGDIAAGEAFLDHIRPFVWRRSLDFGAIDEIRRLTHRIRDKQSGPPVPQPGYNLKLGRGGIREIEFFAQTHQLIHGGRDPALRVRGTRQTLDALAATGRISQDDARALGESYDGLRTIEHRLQMIGDQQTHSLPSGEALDTAARLHGLADGAALVEYVRDLARPVAERFDALHRQRYGHTMPDPIQLIHLRVRGIGKNKHPEIKKAPTRLNGKATPIGSRQAYCFAIRDKTEFRVFLRKDLKASDKIEGPAVVEEDTTTLILHSDQRLHVDDFGHLIIRGENKV